MLEICLKLALKAHLVSDDSVVPRIEIYAHPPKYYGGLRIQSAGSLVLERNSRL